ncbi:MAG: hypothetical protein AAGM22_17645 [Acidobacteriota bacterium]
MNDVNVAVIHTERCAAAFCRMFWAFIFFLDFRFGVNRVHIDLLPDFVGWLMMASALTTILDLAPRVEDIRRLAYGLSFLSLFDLVEIRMTQSEGLGPWIVPTTLVSTVSAVLNIVLIWKLCGLIMDMASRLENETMRERAEFRRKLYATVTVLLSLAAALAFASRSFAMLSIFIGFPAAIIIFLLMMGLMKRTENMCRGLPV